MGTHISRKRSRGHWFWQQHIPWTITYICYCDIIKLTYWEEKSVKEVIHLLKNDLHFLPVFLLSLFSFSFLLCSFLHWKKYSGKWKHSINAEVWAIGLLLLSPLDTRPAKQFLLESTSMVAYVRADMNQEQTYLYQSCKEKGIWKRFNLQCSIIKEICWLLTIIKFKFFHGQGKR